MLLVESELALTVVVGEGGGYPQTDGWSGLFIELGTSGG